jgi:Hemerythrin HHE cation binding domain
MPLTATARAATTAAPRYDFYAGIHKALRLFMGDTLVRIGSTDAADAPALQSALGQLHALLSACEQHLEHENRFVHPLLEAAVPGSSVRVAGEHEDHLEAIASLRDLAGLVQHAQAPRRAAALHRLYLALAQFVAENFEHMAIEETAHNPVLWAHYSDPELLVHHDALVASIAPQDMMALLGWFMPALSAPERAGLLGGMRASAPAPAFEAALAIARQRLAPADMTRLAEDLGITA